MSWRHGVETRETRTTNFRKVRDGREALGLWQESMGSCLYGLYTLEGFLQLPRKYVVPLPSHQLSQSFCCFKTSSCTWPCLASGSSLNMVHHKCTWPWVHATKIMGPAGQVQGGYHLCHLKMRLVIHLFALRPIPVPFPTVYSIPAVDPWKLHFPCFFNNWLPAKFSQWETDGGGIKGNKGEAGAFLPSGCCGWYLWQQLYLLCDSSSHWVAPLSTVRAFSAQDLSSSSLCRWSLS